MVTEWLCSWSYQTPLGRRRRQRLIWAGKVCKWMALRQNLKARYFPILTHFQARGLVTGQREARIEVHMRGGACWVVEADSSVRFAGVVSEGER